MNATDLTDTQRHKLMCSVADRRDFFAKLRDRMKKRRWNERDPVYEAVLKAYFAAHEVVKAIHDSQPKQPAEQPRVFTGDKTPAGR